MTVKIYHYHKNISLYLEPVEGVKSPFLPHNIETEIMKFFAVILLTLSFAGTGYAEADKSSAFLGEDPGSLKVQTFYRAQCEQAAAASDDLSDDTRRDQFINACINNMADTWPIGYDESE